jgi:thiol-disulfide isomerase/thioredoxin
MMKLLKRFKILAATLLAMSLLMPAVSFAFPKKGQPAPPFQVVTTSGQKLSLASYKGSVLVIEFFATWCGGCKASIPHLAELQQKFGNQGLHILGLDVGQGDDLEGVKEFVAKLKISYPVAIADEDVVYDGYGIRMVPTLFIVDKKGILVEKLSGYNPEIQKMLETTVKRLVAE